MAISMPQTVKNNTTVNTKNTANDAKSAVTFNTVKNNANSAVQPKTTETVNNEAAVKPQQPVASQSVAQGSAKTISAPSASEQNASVEKTVAEKQTVTQPEVAAQAKANVQPASASVKPQIEQNVQKISHESTNDIKNQTTSTSDVQKNVEVNNQIEKADNAMVESKESFNTTASSVASEQNLSASLESAVKAPIDTQANSVKGIAAVNASTNNVDESDKDSDDNKNTKKSAFAVLTPMQFDTDKIPDPFGNWNGNLPAKITFTNSGASTAIGAMTETVNGQSGLAWCLEPWGSEPWDPDNSANQDGQAANLSGTLRVNDDTQSLLSGKANLLAGVLYYGYKGPKSIVGTAASDADATDEAADVAAWDLNYQNVKTVESSSAYFGSYVMTQAQIDKMASDPEVAKILQAAKNWTPQVMEKDGYTLKAYEGRQMDSFDPHGFKNGQLIFTIQWAKGAAKPQTQPATQKPTQKPSQKTTQKVTQAVTQKPTQKVTQAVTQKPTQKVTQAVTQKPTQKVTQAVTQKPTQKVTQAITQKPTQKVTQAVTQKPTQKVTQAVTQKPTQKVTQAVTPAPISIGTTLIGTSGHELAISKDAIATDTVNYTGLIVGQKYTMTGTLMNKATGKPIMNNGKAVTASTTFTAQKANGSVTVIFHLDDTDYEGDSLVAFESLSDGTGKQIANHDDINDKAETDIVEKPEIGTTLVGSTGTHLLPFSGNTVATDTVNYTDLIPGKQYKLVGTLMDKATGKPVMNNGKPVTATTIFTPTTANGVATVVFHFNDEGYKGDSLVAYEDLYDAKSGQLIAKHEDLNDLSETDTVKKPKKHTPMIQYQTQSQNVYVSSPSPVVEQAASPVIESPAAPIVEQVASPAPVVQATSPAHAKGVAQGQGLPETADMSSLTGEALAAAAALAGTVMLIKNHEDKFED